MSTMLVLLAVLSLALGAHSAAFPGYTFQADTDATGFDLGGYPAGCQENKVGNTSPSVAYAACSLNPNCKGFVWFQRSGYTHPSYCLKDSTVPNPFPSNLVFKTAAFTTIPDQGLYLPKSASVINAECAASPNNWACPQCDQYGANALIKTQCKACVAFGKAAAWACPQYCAASTSSKIEMIACETCLETTTNSEWACKNCATSTNKAACYACVKAGPYSDIWKCT